MKKIVLYMSLLLLVSNVNAGRHGVYGGGSNYVDPMKIGEDYGKIIGWLKYTGNYLVDAAELTGDLSHGFVEDKCRTLQLFLDGKKTDNIDLELALCELSDLAKIVTEPYACVIDGMFEPTATGEKFIWELVGGVHGIDRRIVEYENTNAFQELLTREDFYSVESLHEKANRSRQAKRDAQEQARRRQIITRVGTGVAVGTVIVLAWKFRK